LPEQIVAEMNLVAPLVTPELLEQCKAKLESESFLGAKYKVVSKLSADVRASCIVQHRGSGPLTLQSNVRSVAYVARLTKIAGIYGTGSKHKIGGCRFDLLNGKVELNGLVPERIKYTNACRWVSSVGRPAGATRTTSRLGAPGGKSNVA
jgi:hypothetical protein